MERPPQTTSGGTACAIPADAASGTLVIYYVLDYNTWASSAVWGARALVALALHYLFPWVDLVYSDSDCGPGCADLLDTMESFSYRGVHEGLTDKRPGAPRVPVVYADAAAPVNTGCFLLPRDPEHELRVVRTSPMEGDALKYSEAQFDRLLEERAPFLLGKELTPIHLLQYGAD